MPPTDERRSAEAESVQGSTRRAVRINVDDGHVIAAADPTLTDPAADVLWRVVEKATRKNEIG